MSYSELVESNLEVIQAKSFGKLATDLAMILDVEMFRIGVVGQHPDPYFAIERERVFSKLCAVFVQAGLKPPDMEVAFFTERIPGEGHFSNRYLERSKGISDKVYELLADRGEPEATLVSALALTLSAFPDGCDYLDMLAMINKTLVVDLGLDPIRPDYGQLEIRLPATQMPSQGALRVVAVDDNKNDLIKTLFALAGWPGLELLIYHYPGEGWGKPEPEERDRRLREVRDRVLELQPDLVLQDQGLSDLEGSDLVPFLREGKPDILILGNTGGQMDKFRTVRVYGNFKKGDQVRDLQDFLK